MAYESQITGSKFADIGTTGETPGFEDFPASQFGTDGNIQNITQRIELDRDTVFGPTNALGYPGAAISDAVGKKNLLAHTKVEVDRFIATTVDTLNVTNTDVNVKIFVTGVAFKTKPTPSVVSGSVGSNYVERTDIILVAWTAKVQVIL